VDAAFVGSTVLVSNGVYASGARAVGSSSSNRVVIPSLRTVQSVNGPAMTAIQGSQVPVTTNGATAVRCVWLAPNATLSGFTLTNGATATDFVGEGPPPERTAGGAVYAEDASATVWDCVLTGNASAYYGGASFGGTLYQCLINRNWTGGDGGGAYESILNNCCLFNNESTGYGGGALYSTLNNCTVTANFPSGAEACTLNNCIVFGNTPANHESIYGASTLNFCCTSPLPEGGVGNITNTPSFVDPASHNYHLQSDSSCINAGDPSHVPTGPDLEGNPRISGGTVDIGAYEFQSPSSVLSYAWAQQYGLPTDGSADFVDADGEGANNWQEWRADTIPTNAACVLRMATVTNEATGLNVSWESVATRSYWLERAEDMGAVPAFQTIATNLPGVAGSSTYNDTSATNGGTYYYRVGVQ
jgi:hypothetical protein